MERTQTKLNAQQQEWQEWQHHPQTKELLNRLQQARQETCHNWSKGEFIGDSLEEMALRNAKALGGISVLDQIIDIVTGEENVGITSRLAEQ